MDMNDTVPVEKENAAIDMNICMVVADLAEMFHRPIEEILPQFLESQTCALLYKRKYKLWWDGPTAIVDIYLEEIGEARQEDGSLPYEDRGSKKWISLHDIASLKMPFSASFFVLGGGDG